METFKIIKLFRNLFVLTTLLLTSLTIFSQSKTINFRKLDIHGVLFNANVSTLFEDSFGYLWIGSNSGLYKYDGHNITEYQNDVFNPYSLPNNNINSIFEDDFHNLWIGSESYLITYNRKKNKFKGFLKNKTSIVKNITKTGNIWVRLENYGLLKIQTNEDFNKINLVSEFTPKISKDIYKIEKTVIALIEDRLGRNWIGTNEGIFILNANGKFTPTNFKEKIVGMKLFGNNQIITITHNGMYIFGYNKSDSKLEILEHYPNILNNFNSNATLSTIAINKKNNALWIGTTDGLIKANRKNNKYHFSYYSNHANNINLLNNNITSSIFDTYGNLWVGSSKGVNKYLERTSLFEYNQITTDNKLASNLYSENYRHLLVGMTNGLYNYDNKTKTNLKIENDIGDVSIINKSYEKKEFFIADKLSIYKTQNYKPDKTKFDLMKIKTYSNRIKDIVPINKNEVWVAIWEQGIDIINNENPLSEFKKQIRDKLKNNHTSTLLLTGENKLWIGTRGEGLYIVDLVNENYKHYLPTLENGLTSNAILTLHEDKSGNIWIGTRGGGLNMYEKKLKIFKNFNDTNTASPKIISAIEEDINGNIWMSTRDGITMLNLTTKRFMPFGVEDGINENQFVFNSSSSNAQKTILYFGCSDGFYSVFPQKLSTQNILPSTVITSFSTLGKTFNNNLNNTANTSNEINIFSDNPIILPYDQNNIAVNFSSLDLTAPNKNEYAYKLKGLNNYWVYTSAFNRNANYNDLAPGTYTFMVKSSNSDGVWNEEPSKVTFTIAPPIWKSTWAILIYILIVLLIIYINALLIRRWYLLKKNLVRETISREKDNEHNKMKMAFFTDISHELRTPLSLILGTIEKVVKDKEFTLNPLSSQRIYNNVLRMHRLINQIMDIRKFDEGKLQLNISRNDIISDIKTIKNAFNDFANNSNIKYDFISKEKILTGWYDVDILEKILFNLLSNAFKYTKEKGEITVTLSLIKPKEPSTDEHSLNGNKIKCSVRDNGIGIPKKDLNYIFDRYYQATKSQRKQIPGTGIGMELVHKLIERHHGNIMVESEEHVYTEFTFYLPIYKNRYQKNELMDKGMPLKRNFIKASEFQVIDKPSNDFINIEQKKQHKKSKILIVEDNDDLRQMIKEELSTEFNIIEASDGKEGYEVALEEKPDLIISDILMPIQDGISMLKQIKKNPEFNNIPIFMLTAKNSSESKIECLSLGANDYIEKPFSLDFLKWKLKNTFKTRQDLKVKYSKLITTAPIDIQVDSNDEKFIKKIIKIIEDNMNNNILNVEFLASEIGMSRANLYRKVQTILNDTPINFIKTIKLKRAAQLLEQNKMYISEVAYMTGFNNQKYFSKCFNKEYGISPTEYIKQSEVTNKES
ncbi:hybrid sensor histidine kinase/response regulator transcription factor [Labilibaculum antarcticum]|uniref:histidine kinase n=1 Tax=Labilibaculum antarcticum TaxID=1717717 RepID=A0A1Y1CEU0_9BACT|nr:hybrid sensor histidine kinase/response regulator transcription factor [Labilibaculum antarcticum]BAX78830.1 hybrid sensor histidine kinase/response regulator [Labilibaculum antarcticum]